MKKLTLLTFAFITLFAFTSCKKTCDCTITTKNFSGKDVSYTEQVEKEKKKSCSQMAKEANDAVDFQNAWMDGMSGGDFGMTLDMRYDCK